MNPLPALILGCFLACRVSADRLTIYVSPNGNDAWSGALATADQSGTDGPLATISAALNKSRALRRNAPGTETRILVAGGTYSLAAPLDILPEDSGLVLAAQPGQEPVLTGERQITGWHQGAGGNIWQAEIPAARNRGWVFHELFVNGRRTQRARIPASGFFRAAAGPIKGHLNQLRVKTGDINPDWAAQGDVELIVLCAWEQSRNQIRSYSEAENLVELAGRAFYASEPNPRYYIENAPNSLQPGQWYLDSQSGIVSYWPEPGENPASEVVTAPHLYELVRLNGRPGAMVHRALFRGLTFTGTDWDFRGGTNFDLQAAIEAGAAFVAQEAESCVVQQCLFARMGGYAVDFGLGCRSNSIVGCEMTDLGAGGIRLGESTLQSAMNHPNTVNVISDNHIHQIGLVDAGANGICVMLSSSNTIAHNEIDHTFSCGISVGWTWGYGPTPCCRNIVEYNHVHDIGQGMLSDMGGIYTLGVQPGTILGNNLIHDVACFIYGAWGLYTDEGSSGILIESNIVYRCQSAGFQQHYGATNVIRNNIFALNHDAELVNTRPEPHIGFIFTNNIIYQDSGRDLVGNWWSNNFIMDHNIYFDTRTGSAQPLLTSELKFSDWQAQGHDVHSVFMDPMFAAPLSGDFRLGPDSRAVLFGFHPIDMSGVGVRKAFARRSDSNEPAIQ